MPTLSASQIAGYARQAGFTGAEVPIAVAIALAESGGNTDAPPHKNSNGSYDYGLWQINTINSQILASGNWRDPADNARMAYAIYQQQGWRAWTVYKSGSYAKFLTQGDAASKVPGTVEPTGVSANPFDAITKAVAFFVNPHTWLRLATIVTGGALILLGLALIGWKNAPQAVKDATKTAITKKVPA